MSLELVIVAVLGALVVGWLARGMRGSPDLTGPLLERLARDLDAIRVPEVTADDPVEMKRVRDAINQRWTPRNEEREQALREALGRIAAFLQEGVRDTLTEALEHGPARYQSAIETAVGAIHDLEFFLRDPITPDEAHDLGQVVQQVAREFIQDWNITVRMRQAGTPVRAHVHGGSFMDAVYLLLHNAGQFGESSTIDVTVKQEENDALVVIRDRGPGFTEEALERAHDLFYTTTETGLGLGIPFARKTIESFGGTLDIANRSDGGAEVRLSLPAA